MSSCLDCEFAEEDGEASKDGTLGEFGVRKSLTKTILAPSFILP
jgi:hypothetical protein